MITEGAAPSRPIRLAVAWYADTTTLGGPQAIVTEDVEYQGSFPLDYSFSLYGPPPDAALNASTVAGATFRAAWGVLIAYEDLNGDGQLDLIPDGGSPIDLILATSIGDIFNGDPAANPVRVAYIDGQAPASLEGFTAGYNFYQQQDGGPSQEHHGGSLPERGHRPQRARPVRLSGLRDRGLPGEPQQCRPQQLRPPLRHPAHRRRASLGESAPGQRRSHRLDPRDRWGQSAVASHGDRQWHAIDLLGLRRRVRGNGFGLRGRWRRRLAGGDAGWRRHA